MFGIREFVGSYTGRPVYIETMWTVRKIRPIEEFGFDGGRLFLLF